MHGNVAEWCWDLYSEYGSVADIDRAGVFSQVRRVFRGGSWLTTTMRLRSAFRDHAYPSHQNMSIGFRVAFNDESRVD
jgi:formylglycine-generating enzyme required for sulfatase activity